jgi:Na+-translocating ferredoxin:NAD+ oxidoreductase RnfG subunit
LTLTRIIYSLIGGLSNMKLRNNCLIYVAAFPAAFVVPAAAQAVQYLTVEQAKKIIFPEASAFEETKLTFSDFDRKEIERLSGSEPDDSRLEIWEAKKDAANLGHFIVNEVIGKHELITYAVGVLSDGSVTAVEILDYREGQGGQIRDIAWRLQFAGKSLNDKLDLGDDIKNISGATYSCKHVTEGIRKLLAIFQVKLKK